MQGINGIALDSNPFVIGIENKISSSDEVSKTNFSDVFKEAINKVNDSQVNANNMIEDFIKGENVSMHDVMISVQESQMSMQLMLEVRNNLVDAYKELNSVQM